MGLRISLLKNQDQVDSASAKTLPGQTSVEEQMEWMRLNPGFVHELKQKYRDETLGVHAKEDAVVLREAIRRANEQNAAVKQKYEADAEAAKQAKRQAYLDDFKNYVQKNLYPMLDEGIAKYNDPAALQAQHVAAQSNAKRALASEYAARGLSGSGSYDTALGKTMADMSLQFDQQLQQRQDYARELMGKKVGYEGLFSQSGLDEDKYQTALASAQDQFNKGFGLQQQQFDWQKYVDKEKIEAAKPGFLNYLSAGLGVAGTVMGGYGAIAAAGAANSMSNYYQSRTPDYSYYKAGGDGNP